MALRKLVLNGGRRIGGDFFPFSFHTVYKMYNIGFSNTLNPFFIPEFKQRFYRVSEVTAGIAQSKARRMCNERGMDLPMLKTLFEGRMWKQLVTDFSLSNLAWLGTVKGNSHTGFIWDDGTPNDLGLTANSNDCMAVMTGGTFVVKPCADNTGVFQLICQGLFFLYHF